MILFPLKIGLFLHEEALFSSGQGFSLLCYNTSMKKIFCLLLITISFFGGAVKADDNFDVSARHAIAIENSTGKILYEKDSNTSAGIASITKILTVYLVYKEIQAGELKWDDKVKISNYAYGLTTNYETSNVPMEAREYTVKQLVEATMIASANSAAIALAEKIAGTEPKFVDLMKKQLDAWGIKDYKLVNASGLNNSLLGENIYPGTSSEDENMMSAKSVAIIAHHLINDFPDVLKITSQTTADFAGTPITTYNYMLPNMSYARDGVDGLKTGTTELAGASFVATSTENKMRIITVVLNADNADIDTNARFKATNDLLNYVSQNYEARTLVAKGKSYRKSIAKIVDGKEKTVSSIAEKSLTVIEKKTAATAGKLKIETSEKGYVATVKKGSKVGKAVFYDSDLVGDGYIGQVPSVNLLAKKEVKRSFFLKVWWNHFVIYVNEKL